MNTTTNYELNLPEGSDLFAPMTDYNPNFTKIDSAMAENRNAAVHSATEAIAGTVHNITRDEPDATMFRWTATGNFTSGDTFTVDGVSVTAIGANGQGLVTGAWLTGTEVLASLVGSVMTVYTSAASSDAETLEGHPASYFATATAVEQAQSDATAAGTLANSAQTRADEAYNLASAAGGWNVEELWSNPNGNTTQFSPRTVNLTSTTFNNNKQPKFLMIQFAHDIPENSTCTAMEIIPLNEANGAWFGSDSAYLISRDYSVSTTITATNTQINMQFKAGYRANTYGQQARTISNYMFNPQKIYLLG